MNRSLSLVSAFLLLLFFAVISESISSDATSSLRREKEIIADPTANEFDRNQADISVWLSAAASCGKDNIKTHTFKGPSTGFIVTDTVSDILIGTEGYIGYLPSDNSIYVVYRGTDSSRDWFTDIDARKAEYSSFPECNCQVHKGFYEAEQHVIDRVIREVRRLQVLYPTYSVKITGYSLGAALAQLTSMDLIKAGVVVKSVYTFGQPRTGDQAYSSFVGTKGPVTWRVVHNKDVVPHLPSTDMGFYHVCREQFEDANGNLKTCDTSCEDPTCSDQFTLGETNRDDHGTYLGLRMSCEAVSQ
jgi:predicted lipase